MKNNIIIIFILSLFLNGCSFLVKLSVLEENHSVGWSKQFTYRQIDPFFSAPYTYYWSEYKDEQTSIILSTRPRYSRRLLFGPAYFIPFLPNIFNGWQERNSTRFSDKFILDIIIIDKNNDLSIDLSKLSYNLNEENVVPCKIFIDKSSFIDLKDSSYNYFLNNDCKLAANVKAYNWDFGNFVETKDSTIQSNNNMIALRIEFSELNYSVDKFSINFFDFITSKKSKLIPKLEFVDRNIYYYIPFEFGH